MMTKEDKTEKNYNKEPNIRIKRVFKRVLESKGMISVGQAMRDEGYPATTAKNPQQLTRSKSWINLLKEHLPEESLSKVHKRLLNAFKLGHFTFPLSVKDESIIELLDATGCSVMKIKYGDQAKHVYFMSPDNLAQDKALDKAYKLMGKYAPTKLEFTDDYEGDSDKELRDRIRKLRERRREITSSSGRKKSKKSPKVKKKK